MVAYLYISAFHKRVMPREVVQIAVINLYSIVVSVVQVVPAGMCSSDSVGVNINLHEAVYANALQVLPVTRCQLGDAIIVC